MNLLAPFALWGLLALALPVALHLRRRRVGRTVQVGSVRHLGSLPTAERRGLRLREPWLLLLRSTIVALLAFLLAGPMLDRPVREGRPVALVDSGADPALIDSLGRGATLLVERIDDPWHRVQELDDSLPPNIPLLVAASTRSDLYHGPRPVVRRPMAWYPGVRGRPSDVAKDPIDAPRRGWTTPQRHALAVAVAAISEEFGPITDSVDWESRLPAWWQDSLTAAAFPIAVAHALAPAKAFPAPVSLAIAQILPRQRAAVRGRSAAVDLHWWIWALALALFASERLWSLRRRGLT